MSRIESFRPAAPSCSGGGIAMQFAHQFPERTDRLVMIGSGGLGRQLTPMLRAATLLGANTVVAMLARFSEV